IATKGTNPAASRERRLRRLEPDAGKLACPVLRGGDAGNSVSLPDRKRRRRQSRTMALWHSSTLALLCPDRPNWREQPNGLRCAAHTVPPSGACLVRPPRLASTVSQIPCRASPHFLVTPRSFSLAPSSR